MPLRLAVTSFLLLALLASRRSSSASEDDRESRVLRAIQGIVHAEPGPHFNSRDVLLTAIRNVRVEGAGRSLWVPVLPGHCGTGMRFGGLEAAAAGTLGERLFAAYGLEAAIGDSIDGRLWSLPSARFDRAGKVGFVVVPAPGPDAPPFPWDDVSKRLRPSGLRLLVVPARHYRSMPADGLTPQLAFALSVVDFLNRTQKGVDVGLEAIANGRTRELPLPELRATELPRTSSFSRADGNVLFVAEGRGTVTLSFDPPKGTRKAGIGLVVLPFHWTPPMAGGVYEFDRPGPAFVLMQDALRLESRSAVFATPPAFDASRPFRVRIDYTEGQNHLGGPLTIRRP